MTSLLNKWQSSEGRQARVKGGSLRKKKNETGILGPRKLDPWVPAELWGAGAKDAGMFANLDFRCLQLSLSPSCIWTIGAFWPPSIRSHHSPAETDSALQIFTLPLPLGLASCQADSGDKTLSSQLSQSQSSLHGFRIMCYMYSSVPIWAVS